MEEIKSSKDPFYPKHTPRNPVKSKINPLLRPASLAAIITLAAASSAQAQSIRTWDGGTGGTGTLLDTNTNWSADALPVSGDTAQWNGTVAGNLVLDYTTAFVNTSNGVSLDITSAQTGSLTIGTSNGSSMSVQNISIASGAGAFTYGDGTGPDSFGFRGGPSHTLTNNDNDTATFAAGISFFTGNGSNRTLNFAGTGNWAINSALSTTTGAISVTKQDVGTLTLSGANAYRGVTTISGGTLSVSSIANGGVTGPGITTTANSTTATVSSTAGLSIGQTVVSQRITNGTTITGINTGTNTITLSIAASATPGTGVSSTIGTGNGLGLSNNAATNLVFGGGTLQYTGNTAISDRAFTINASKTATIEVTTANQSLTLAGATGATTDGALTKTGAGTLTLSGINTYGGATTVSGGTLLINGSSSAASAVAVNTGTLGGTGSVLGPVTVAATGSLAPGPTTGPTTGTLAVASADLSAGGTLTMQVDDASTPVSDLLAVAGTLNVTGAKLAISATGTPTAPSYLIATATAITGTIAPSDITGLPAGYTVQQTATAITLVGTHANWLTANAPATGFVTDSDNDGVPNGLENVLGTNPNASSAGLTEISATASSATFKHTLNPTIASDVSYTYEWSTDLIEWKASGETNTGTTTATITPSAPVSGVVTVTTAITSGPASKLFTRIKATQP